MIGDTALLVALARLVAWLLVPLAPTGGDETICPGRYRIS